MKPCNYFIVHSRGIVHCDIKPLNIIITSPGEPIVIDLGAARFVGEEITRDEIVISPLYSAPELYSVQPVDARVDVYSLGITLLHMISGLPDITGLILGENVVTGKDDRPHRIYATILLQENYADLPSQEILRQHTDKMLTQIGFPQLRMIVQQAIANEDQRFKSVSEFNAVLTAFV